MTKFCLGDFETTSACDLKKAGAWVYAADPTTNIACLGYTLDGRPPMVLRADDLIFGSSDPELEAAAADPGCMFIAHNAAFEKAIWREIMVKVYGWPDIPNERWHDIMAVCAMKGLPLKLERAAMAMNLHAQKDTEGSRLIKAMSKTSPKGYYAKSDEEWEGRLQRAMVYCKSDIVAELELHRAVRSQGAEERKVWLLDQKINERGVRLDMNFVGAMQTIVDQSTGPMLAEFRALTGIDKLASPKLKDWLIANGTIFPIGEAGELDTSLTKEAIAKLLGENDDDEEESLADAPEMDFGGEGEGGALPDGCRRALEIRRVLGSASVKKLGAMQSCCGVDGRARGLLQYHGAGPGRWAGRLLQPQNFTRPFVKIGDEAVRPEDLNAAILTRDAEYVNALYGNPIGVVASSLRGAIIPSEGNLLTVGDFATIEAIIVLALAGQHDQTAKIAAGQKPYIPMAEKIFKRKIDKHADLAEYTIGKNTVLGCGFGMGHKKFRSRYAPTRSEEFAKSCIDAYRKDFAPLVPDLWYGLGDAATDTVWTGRPHEAYGVTYRLEDGWMTARLPSGRKLWYRDPKPTREAMPWDMTDVRRGFTYRAWKLGQWKLVKGYGALMTENVVQGLARDMLVHAMFGCEENNLPLVLTVHDEPVTDAPGDNAKLLNQIMCDQPRWVHDLQIPVSADCWTDVRYRK